MNNLEEIKTLIQTLKTAQDRETLNKASEEIIKFGELAVPLLLECLDTTEEHLKEATITILNNMGHKAKKAAPTLIAIVKNFGIENDPNYGLSALAAHTLGSIGNEEAIPCLIEALKDHNYLSTCAAGALGKLKNKKAIPSLIKVLKDNRKFWVPRGAAAISLGCFGSDAKEALPALKKALTYDCNQSEEWDIRAKEAVEDAINQILDSNQESKLKENGLRFEMFGIE